MLSKATLQAQCPCCPCYTPSSAMALSSLSNFQPMHAMDFCRSQAMGGHGDTRLQWTQQRQPTQGSCTCRSGSGAGT